METLLHFLAPPSGGASEGAAESTIPSATGTPPRSSSRRSISDGVNERLKERVEEGVSETDDRQSRGGRLSLFPLSLLEQLICIPIHPSTRNIENKIMRESVYSSGYKE